MLRLLALALILGLLALLLGPVALLYSGLQTQPLVQPAPSPRQQDVARIKALLQQHDPRKLRDGETGTFTITERDLNIGLRTALPAPERQRARAALKPGLGTLHYTLALPGNPLGDYLNLSLRVAEEQGQPAIDSLQLGQLSIPGWLLAPLTAIADHQLMTHFPEYSGAREALQSLSIASDQLSLNYRYDRALAKQIEQRGRDMLLPAADRERAIAYYQVLARTSREAGSKASLDRLLWPLFEEARRRSNDTDAAAENRVLLLVLGTVLNRSSMHRLVGGDPNDLSPGHRYVKWTLQGRGDLAQHFAISAAIAAAGGGTLADAIGVFKELDDSRGGSGFSFADLLADRAGVQLSTVATGPNARELQRAIAANPPSETTIMPPIGALPEGIMEMEFKQRYNDLDDVRYAAVKDEIERRINQLSLYNK